MVSEEEYAEIQRLISAAETREDCEAVRDRIRDLDPDDPDRAGLAEQEVMVRRGVARSEREAG